MTEGELLWQDRAAGLAIHLSGRPSPAALALLDDTVWGGRELRYRILDLPGKLERLSGPHVLTLHERGVPVAVCVLNRRETRLLERPVDSFHFVMLATATTAEGRGFASLLARHATDFVRSRIGDPGMGYAYVEESTAFSLDLSGRMGASLDAPLPLTLVSRLRPADDPRAGLLETAEAAGVVERLEALYAGHLFADFAQSLRPGEYFVLREGGRVLAGVQAERLSWSVAALPGATGWAILNLWPRLPPLRGILDPQALDFLRLGNLLVEPGREADLLRLVEAVLARQGLHLALVLMDERSPVGRRLRAARRRGLLARAVSGRVRMVADFAGLTGAERSRLGGHPVLMSPADVF